MGDLNDPVLQKISIVVPGEFSEALADAGAGVWLWDIVADRIDVSLGMVALTGMPELNGGRRDEVLAGLIHPEDISKIRESTARLFDGAKNYETLCRMRHSSGHYIWVNTHGTLVRDEEGEPQFLIGIVRIRDELTRAKRDLLHAEEMAKLGNWNVDIASQELFWSEGVYNMLGYEPLSFTPSIEFGYSLLSTEDRETIENIIDDALTTKENFDFRSRLRHANGSEVHVEVRGAVEVGVTGAPVSYYGIIQNITDEIKREQQIRQSQKLEAVGNLTGGIAHDFNNILYALLGYADLALDDIPEVHPAHVPLLEIRKAGDRAANLVAKMLAFGRRSEGKRESMVLAEVVSDCLDLVRASIPTTVRIEADLSNTGCCVFADATQLHQVLLNLCSNAQYAMRENGGLLRISVDDMILDANAASRLGGLEAGEWARIRVSDTGPGIDPAVLERIFEPYFTTRKPDEGTGLGLAMVHGIVAGFGGVVLVDSRLGVGSEFSIYLPAEVAPTVVDGVADGVADSGASAVAGHGRIMVIDDEPMVLDVLEKALLRFGFEVRAFANGIEALEVFRASPHNFDVVVTDQTMPNITGFELATHMMAIRPDLPLILTTGYADKENQERAQIAGIRYFMPKPLKMMELGEALLKLTSKVTVS